jgi:alpha-mannosidase
MSALTIASAHGQVSVPTAESTHQDTLYVVGYSHLDTEWCWSYPQVIREFLPNTLHQNFRLFDLYPDYTFNWTGSNRYRLIKEYYPNDYAKLKAYIAAGRWFPAGSSVEEGDVNNPSEESLIRQVLYGNEYFRREFGKASDEYMLPDCFGFPASLPSILAHCGIKGFSTQKLTWGSAVGIPFNVGLWQGPDGRSVIAALNAGDYNGTLSGDMSQNQDWIKRVEGDGDRSGVYVDYRYYGVGDRGGAPAEDSVKSLETSLHGTGPLKIIAGPADAMFDSITPDQLPGLPRYKGDLLLTKHSAGSLTSGAAQKRWNRKNELLADDTERASVAADWLGALPYDRERITDAWLRFLPGQFHDLLAGTALPKAYTYAWNDQAIASNEFAGVLREANGGICRALDTRVKGAAVVVYNPLSVAREDVVEATVTIPSFTKPNGKPSPRAPLPNSLVPRLGEGRNGGLPYVQVFGSDGRKVPSQIVSRSGNRVTILFAASAPSVGWAVYDVRPSTSPAPRDWALLAGVSGLENRRYRVRIDRNGDIASIFDKAAHRELLRAPIRLAFEYEDPAEYPAWNMDWDDQKMPPIGYVGGPAKISVLERGPARVAVRIERQARGSTFVQTVRLASGDAGNRVEIENKIDWKSSSCALKMVTPLTVSNPEATYNWELGTVRRGNDDPTKYEVPTHKWLDLTDVSGKYGVSILDDGKVGSDKPDDSTLRMTMLYTPGVRGGFQHQATQDWGRHDFTYAIFGHNGNWTRRDATQWQAARLNQPMLAFQAPSHSGSLGRTFSFARTSSPHVQIESLKKAEDTGDIVVRLNELAGADAKDVSLAFASPIVAAREVDGQERTIKADGFSIIHGRLVFDMQAYRPRAFAVRLASTHPHVPAPVSAPLRLAYNVDVASPAIGQPGGDFDGDGNAIPGGLLPEKLVSGGILFHLAPATSGKKNAVACRGQQIALPAGKGRHLYLVAAVAGGDVTGVFRLDSASIPLSIRRWNGFLGQWDTRRWKGKEPELTYNWNLPIVDLVPGYVDRDPVAWYADHIRTANGEDLPYQFCYLFRYSIALPDSARTLTLPKDPRIRVMAVTVATDPNADATPACDLYERLDRTGGDVPMIEPQGGRFHGPVLVTLDGPLYHWGVLQYTVDGSDPVATSPVYSGPFSLTHSATVHVRSFDRADHGGPIVRAKFVVAN